jgi:hypothetical protein
VTLTAGKRSANTICAAAPPSIVDMTQTTVVYGSCVSSETVGNVWTVVGNRISSRSLAASILAILQWLECSMNSAKDTIEESVTYTPIIRSPSLSAQTSDSI